MKHSFFIIFIPVSLLLACGSRKSQDNNKNDTIAAVDEIITTETQPKETEKTASLDSIYILEQEADISIEMKSLPFKPDFAYVANNALFFGEKENLKSENVPVKGKLLCFTWSPDGKFIYFALKTQVNKIAKKEIEKLEEQGQKFEAYDLKIYKFDFQKPSKAEYITTIYNRTNEYTEGDDYFLDYGDPDFNTTCNGDTLLIHCEPMGGEGGFLSTYAVVVSDRKTSLYYNKNFKCIFPGDADKVDNRRLKFKVSGDNLKVFYNNEKSKIILNHNSWTTLFGKNPDIIKNMKTYDSYSPNFDFSISPGGNKIVFSAFTLAEIDVRTGATYIYDPKDSTTFTVRNKVVFGSWYDGELRWLSNSNLRTH